MEATIWPLVAPCQPGGELPRLMQDSTGDRAQRHGVRKSTISNIWRSHESQAPLARDLHTLARPPHSRETDGCGRAAISIRRNTRWCSVSTRRAKFKPLDRHAAGLAPKKGRCGTMTHDYKRHGTTTLFAALDVLQGKVIGQCYARHRHQEFVRFLRRLDHEFPGQTP